MTSKTKNILFLSVFGLIILALVYYQNEKEISLRSNKKLTIGKLTQIRRGSKAKKIYEFKYIIDNKWIKGQDPAGAAWPIYFREGEPQIGKYYPVEYDKTDVEYSKIMITKHPLTEEQVENYLN